MTDTKHGKVVRSFRFSEQAPTLFMNDGWDVFEDGAIQHVGTGYWETIEHFGTEAMTLDQLEGYAADDTDYLTEVPAIQVEDREPLLSMDELKTAIKNAGITI